VIVCRRPLALYDVDLLGAAGLLLLGFAAWWTVWAPWQRTWHECRALGAERRAAEIQLQQQLTELERFEKGRAWLESQIAGQSERAPGPAALPTLLQQMTELARDAHLELVSVKPQPAAREGVYLVSDVQFAGRGQSRDFIRFLDRLAEQNPYQRVRTCAVRRPAQAAEPRPCELEWSVRLYLQPAGRAQEPNAGPTGRRS
jgi:hypothetical protein